MHFLCQNMIAACRRINRFSTASAALAFSPILTRSMHLIRLWRAIVVYTIAMFLSCQTNV